MIFLASSTHSSNMYYRILKGSAMVATLCGFSIQYRYEPKQSCLVNTCIIQKIIILQSSYSSTYIDLASSSRETRRLKWALKYQRLFRRRLRYFIVYHIQSNLKPTHFQTREEMAQSRIKNTQSQDIRSIRNIISIRNGFAEFFLRDFYLDKLIDLIQLFLDSCVIHYPLKTMC